MLAVNGAYTSIKQLFKATGLFNPVDVAFNNFALEQPPMNPWLAQPKTVEEQWSVWRTTVNPYQNFFGYREYLFQHLA